MFSVDSLLLHVFLGLRIIVSHTLVHVRRDTTSTLNALFATIFELALGLAHPSAFEDYAAPRSRCQTGDIVVGRLSRADKRRHRSDPRSIEESRALDPWRSSPQ